MEDSELARIDEINSQLKKLPFTSPEIEPLVRELNLIMLKQYRTELRHRISKNDANRHLRER